MTLITQSQLDQLFPNGRAQRDAIDNDTGAIDFKPVVKLFTPDAQCTWLLTELGPDGDLAFRGARQSCQFREAKMPIDCLHANPARPTYRKSLITALRRQQ